MGEVEYPKIWKAQPTPYVDKEPERKGYLVWLFGCKLKMIYFTEAPSEIDLVVRHEDGSLCRMVFQYKPSLDGYDFSHIGSYDKAASSTFKPIGYKLDMEPVENKPKGQEWDWKTVNKDMPKAYAHKKEKSKYVR